MNLDELAAQISSNHLQVSQRLTAIETTMKNNRELYGDIPARVASLEKKVSWIKGATTVVGVLWTALLTFFGIHWHK